MLPPLLGCRDSPYDSFLDFASKASGDVIAKSFQGSSVFDLPAPNSFSYILIPFMSSSDIFLPLIQILYSFMPFLWHLHQLHIQSCYLRVFFIRQTRPWWKKLNHRLIHILLICQSA